MERRNRVDGVTLPFTLEALRLRLYTVSSKAAPAYLAGRVSLRQQPAPALMASRACSTTRANVSWVKSGRVLVIRSSTANMRSRIG